MNELPLPLHGAPPLPPPHPLHHSTLLRLLSCSLLFLSSAVAVDTLLSCVVSRAVVMVCLLRYAQVIEHSHRCWVNTSALVSGCTNAVGLVMVGNFQVSPPLVCALCCHGDVI